MFNGTAASVSHGGSCVVDNRLKGSSSPSKSTPPRHMDLLVPDEHMSSDGGAVAAGDGSSEEGEEERRSLLCKAGDVTRVSFQFYADPSAVGTDIQAGNIFITKLFLSCITSSSQTTESYFFNHQSCVPLQLSITEDKC